ncbi:MAG: glycosyltransferase family 4 protein [Lachnospiraceae bacterium]|nr:glycosyltransferase family 4 protein [Lachnospiraceae bacterium]
MNILLIHNFYKVPGGEDTVFKNEKAMLEKHGHKVFTYTRDNAELDSLTPVAKISLFIDAVYSEKTYREVQKLIDENAIDIVHVHNTQFMVSPSVFAAAKDKNIPVFQTVHNFRMLCLNAIFFRDGHICEECLQKGLKNGVKHKCYRDSRLHSSLALRIQMAARAHKTYRGVNFICLTKFNASKLKEINNGGRKIIDKDRIFVKPNFMPEIKNDIGDNEPLKKNGNNFIYVGRLDKTKGIDIILEAWTKVNDDKKLIICGSGPDEEWCKNYALEKGLSEKVDFRGSLEHNEVISLLRKSDAMLFMSKWYEGFPMTIIEAFTAGTPVIGVNLGNGGDIIAGIYGSRDRLLKFDDNLADSLKDAIDGFRAEDYVFDRTSLAAYGEEENYKALMKIYETGSRTE